MEWLPEQGPWPLRASAALSRPLASDVLEIGIFEADLKISGPVLRNSARLSRRYPHVALFSPFFLPSFPPSPLSAPCSPLLSPFVHPSLPFFHPSFPNFPPSPSFAPFSPFPSSPCFAWFPPLGSFPCLCPPSFPLFSLCVLSPAFNLSKKSCVFQFFTRVLRGEKYKSS